MGCRVDVDAWVGKFKNWFPGTCEEDDCDAAKADCESECKNGHQWIDDPRSVLLCLLQTVHEFNDRLKPEVSKVDIHSKDDDKAIKKAYRKVIRTLHPDRSCREGTTCIEKKAMTMLCTALIEAYSKA